VDIGPHDLLGDNTMARALIISITLLLLSVSAAAAQVACGPYDQITARLATEFKERVRGRGLDGQNRMFEVWSGPNGWTILMTSVRMQSCVMVVGQKGTTWEQLEPLSGDGQATN